jgi:putative toxin-antitoxin system antitoxin component (TIGR02293 family)
MITPSAAKLRKKNPALAARSRDKSGSHLVNFFISHSGRGGKSVVLSKLIQAINAGLPVHELKDLQTGLNVPTERLTDMLNISRATFHRYRTAGSRLGPDVSDRVVRFANLLGKAIKALGDQEDARQWLGSPQFGLGGAVPLDYAKTELGAREVENLLGRIEYGVYS